MQQSGKDKLLTMVKIGPKGQILIPKEAREMFGLAPGDNLVLLADIKRGIALVKMDLATAVADKILAGAYEEEKSEAGLIEEKARFADAMKEAIELGSNKNL